MELPRADRESFDTSHRTILSTENHQLILAENGVRITMQALTHPPRIAVVYGRLANPDWTLTREANGVELNFHAEDGGVSTDKKEVKKYLGWITDYVSKAQA